MTPSTVTRERIAGQLKAVTSGFGSLGHTRRERLRRKALGQHQSDRIEIVMVVILALAVMRGARGEIALGSGVQPHDQRRLDLTMRGLDDLDRLWQMLPDFGDDAGSGLCVDEIALVEQDQVGAEDLVLEDLLQRVVVLDR